MPAYIDSVSVVVNGSVGLSVISSLPASGTFTIDRTRWFCQKHRPSATPNAAAETSTRVRSSSRWPVSGTRSPCPILLMRGTGFLRDGLGVPLRLSRSQSRGRNLRRLRVVVAAYRPLELAHPAAHRAAHVGQLLRPDDHEGDDQDDYELHWSDVRHSGSPLS